MTDSDYVEKLASAFESVANAISATNKDFKYTARAGIVLLVLAISLATMVVLMTFWNMEKRAAEQWSVVAGELRTIKEGLHIEQSVNVGQSRTHEDNVRDVIEHNRKAKEQQ